MDPSTAELEGYCAVARHADLESWIGDVVTLCPRGAEGDTDGRCSASRVDAAGTLRPIALADDLTILRALPASGGRLLLLATDDRLLLARGDGTIERELARWASDPWISEDGERAAWIGLPDGVDEWDFGLPTVVVTQALSDGARTIVAHDELAGAPRPVPGGRDVLYVSARGGAAAFWLAGPELVARQISNVGVTEIEQRFMPVAERQLAWSGGALFYSADGDDGARVLRLALDGGEPSDLGPGAWPRSRPDGSVLTLQPRDARPCAAAYPAGGRP